MILLTRTGNQSKETTCCNVHNALLLQGLDPSLQRMPINESCYHAIPSAQESISLRRELLKLALRKDQ